MKKFTFDLQRFDAVEVANLDALKAAIKDKTGAVEVTLTANIEWTEEVSISNLTSLTINPGDDNFTISGTFSGVKSLDVNGSTVTADAGVKVTIGGNNEITAITGANALTANQKITYDGSEYTKSSGGLLVDDSGAVYGIDSSTNLVYIGDTALFSVEGVNDATGLTYSGSTVTVTDEATGAQETKQSISINHIATNDNTTISYSGTTAEEYEWVLSADKKTATYQRKPYYQLEGGVIVYHNTSDVVKLEFNGEITVPTTETETTVDAYLKTYLTVTPATDSAAGTVALKTSDEAKISVGLLASNNFFTVKTSGYTISSIDDIADLAKISLATGDDAPKIVKDENTAGQALVQGKYTAGYYVSKNGKKLEYQEASEDFVPLATISGLKTAADSYTESITVSNGTVTIDKAALGTGEVSISNAAKSDGSKNEFALALNADARLQSDVVESVAGSIENTANVWELNEDEDEDEDTVTYTVTYKTITPEHWTLANGKISHVAEEETAVLGVISNIEAQNPDGAAQSSTPSFEVSTDRKSFNVKYTKTVDSQDVESTTSAISATAGANGAYTFTVNQVALPTTTTVVTLTDSNENSTLAFDTVAQALATTPDVKWAFNNGVGTLTADLTAGYTNNGTSIDIVAAKDDATLLTISGLADITIDETHPLSNYLEVEGGNAGTDTAPESGTADGKITVTLKKAALGEGPVSIGTNGVLNTYKLALAEDAQMLGESETATEHPTKIPRTQNVWVFENGKATYKQITPAYYSLDGDVITYHEQADNHIYATISGLDSETFDAIKDGFKFEGGKVTFTAEGATDPTEYITVDDTNHTITLNQNILGANSVTMTRDAGTGTEYTLELNTTSEDANLKVAAPAVDEQWWTVESGGKATLHQSLDEGYTLATNGLSVTYTAAIGDRLLAEITGLSKKVVALDKVGAKADDKGVALGIAEDEEAGTAAVFAHKTYNDDNTWKNNVKNQTITLTNDMLAEQQVKVIDRYSGDNNTFQFAFGAGVNTKAVTKQEWQINTDDNSATFVEYKSGYYKKSGKTINYYAETPHTELLKLSGLANIDKATPDGKTITATVGGEEVDYITLNNGTVTVYDAAVAECTAVTLESKNSLYDSYTLTVENEPEYSEEFKDDSGPAYVKTVTTAGLEVSADGKTVTSVTEDSETKLFNITGLVDGADLSTLEYNAGTKTVTLSKDVLGENTVAFDNTGGGDYKFTLAADVSTKTTKGNAWTVTGDNGVTVFGMKDAQTAYYTLNSTDSTTVTYTGGTTGNLMFKLSGNGLDSTAVTAAVADADKDGNATFGNNLFTIDTESKIVTLNAKARATANENTITIEGEGWTLENPGAPAYSSVVNESNWDVSGGTATLKLNAATAGYSRSSDGKTLTYVAKDTPAEFLTITGLKSENISNENLANAYNAKTKTVTLPKDVLGESDITLTSENGETYTLAFANDVQTGSANPDNYTWTTAKGEDDKYTSITFNQADSAYFDTPGNMSNGVITVGYHAQGNATPQFTLNGINEDVIDAETKVTKDKDGNTHWNFDGDGDKYISVNTSTGKITLNEAVLPDSGEITITVPEGITTKYTFYNNFKAPTYSTTSWAEVEAEAGEGESTGKTFKLSYGVTDAGYKLSSDGKTLKVITGGEDLLTISGIKAETGITYNADTKTVTLPQSVLNGKDDVTLTPVNGETYTLALDTDIDPVRQKAENGFAWEYNAGTLIVNSGSMDYYKVTGNTAKYYAANQTSKFTITGLNSELDPAPADDTDGDASFGNYLSVDSKTGKVAIFDPNILPQSGTITIENEEGSTYTFDTDYITQSAYTSTAPTVEGSITNGSATLKLSPTTEGYSISEDSTTLTWDAGVSVKLTGLTAEDIANKLATGIEFDKANKVLKFSESVLDGNTQIAIADDDTSGYKLALATGVNAVNDRDDVTADMWKIDAGTATYRNVRKAFYKLGSDGTFINCYGEAENGADKIVITGLESGLVANTAGEIVESEGNTSLITVDANNNIKVNAKAIDSGEVKITTGRDTYSFDATTQAIMSNTTWTYDATEGEITVKGTYATSGYIVSADKKTIKPVTAGNEVELVTITGLKKGLELEDSAASHFTFDGSTITFKDTTFIDEGSKLDDNDFFAYSLAVASGLNSVDTPTEESKWVVDGDNIAYKPITSTTTHAYSVYEGAVKVTDSTTTNAGNALATISGLKAGTWVAGSTADKFTYKYTDANGEEQTVADAVSLSGTAITLNQAVLPAGDTAAKVTLTGEGCYTFAFTDQEAEQSGFKWTQAKDATSATITANVSKSYELNENSNGITYTPATTATVATISGLKEYEYVAPTAEEGDGDGGEPVAEAADPYAPTALGEANEEGKAIGNGVWFTTEGGVTTIHLKDAALNAGPVTLDAGDNYKLALADTQSDTPTDAWQEENGAVKRVSTTSAHYALTEEGDNAYKEITYNAGGTATAFTITGLAKPITKDGEGNVTEVENVDWGNYLTINEKVVTVSKDVLSEDGISISGEGYTLAIGTGAKQSAEGIAAFSLNDADNSVVYSKTPTAGYVLGADEKSITYNDGETDGAETYFTITGLNITEAPEDWDNYLTVAEEGNVVTVNKAALGDSNVVEIDNTTGNDYTLKLGADVTTERSAGTSAKWIDKQDGTYTYSASTDDYYALKDGKIERTQGTKLADFVTIKVTNGAITATALADTSDNFAGEIDDTKSIQIDTKDRIITLKKAAFNDSAAEGSSVEISAGTSDYKFKLDSDVPQGTGKTETAWTFENGIAKYNVTTTDAYKLDETSSQKKVTLGATTTKTCIEVEGLSSDDGLEYKNGTVKIPSGIITGAVKVTGSGEDYKNVEFEVTGGELTKSETTTESYWELSGTTATYKSKTKTTAGYAAKEDGSVDYSKYIDASESSATTLVQVTGLASGLKLETANGVQTWKDKDGNAINNAFAITDITGAEAGAPNKTITLAAGVLGTSTIKIGNTGTAKGDYKLDVSGVKESADDTDKEWTYSLTSGKDTFKYSSKQPYYTVSDKGDSITYTAPTTYVTVSGTPAAFAQTVQDATASDAKIAALETFIDTDALKDDATIKFGKSENAYLANAGSTVTVTTAGDYKAELADNTGVSAEAESWTYNGTKLILASPMTAGYTLKSTKANNYTLGQDAKNETGITLATISGLDLSAAKSEELIADDSTFLTDVERTAAETAAGADARPSQIAAELEKIAFNKYIQQHINVGENGTITIDESLLGTSNVTIANSGTVDYKLSVGTIKDGTIDDNAEATKLFYDDVDSATAKANATSVAEPEWTFSGGTATYKVTTPEYYFYDEKKNQITYNKAVAGNTVATVKGLLSSKVVGTGTAVEKAQVGEPTEVESGTKTITTTTYEETLYTDTTVVKVNDAGQVGAETIRKTQVVTTTEVATYDSTKDSTTTKTTTTKGAVTEVALPKDDVNYDVEEFVEGVKVDDEHNLIKINQKVLGTSTVTLTNGKNSEGTAATYKLDKDGAFVAPDRTEVKWTGSLKGTSAALKADYQAGYTLDQDAGKITYTAAKNNVTLATISGILIDIATSTKIGETSLQDSIDAAVETAESEGTSTATAKTNATNAFINTWVDEHIKYYGDSATPEDKAAILNATSDATKTSPITFTIQDDAVFNGKNISVTSGDKKTYALALAETLKDAELGKVNAATSYWNGNNYQKVAHAAYYTESTTATTNTAIKYNAAASATTLATVSGLKTTVSKAIEDETATWENNTLTVTQAALGTAKVTLTPKSTTGTYNLALAEGVPTTGTAYKETGDWVISGTTATKKGGGSQAHYTLDDTSTNKTITYTAEKNVQTLLTLKGLSSTASTAEATTDLWEDDGEGTITLKDAALGTTNITLTKGKSTIPYALKFDAGTEKAKPSKVLLDADDITEASAEGASVPAWATSGVNTTLKASITEGWALSADSLTAQYTAAANNKALATLVFDKAGLAEGLADAENSSVTISDDKVVTLANIRKIGEDATAKTNSKMTIKTNTDGLTFNITDEDFVGAASNTKVSVIGSALEDGIAFDYEVNNMVVSGAAGDDNIAFNATGTSTVSVGGGAGNDSITLGQEIEAVTVYGDAGDDIITGKIKTSSETVNKFYGGAGADSIALTAAGTVSVWGDAGADTIDIAGTATYVNGGADDDSIKVATAASVYGDAGNDIIDVTSITKILFGGAGKDKITVGSAIDSVRITGDADDDEIVLKGNAATSTILAGVGNDTISITGGVSGRSSIFGDAGNDTIIVDSVIAGGAENASLKATINGGAGNDEITLKSTADDARILLDAGDDKLTVTDKVSKSTIQAGAGNDSINIATANGVSIFGDAGNDEITASGKVEASTINAGAGNDSINIAAVDGVSIFGDAGNDEITASGTVEKSIINAGAGNDTITITEADGSSITGDAGDDVITFKAGSGTVFGGAGNDTINITNANGVSVLGDAGNDVITFAAGSGTVFGGAGNDTIDLGSGEVTFYYVSGNGNDYVKNFNPKAKESKESKTFALSTGSIKSAAVGGAGNEDLILTIGSNKVTLEGANYYNNSETFSYKSGANDSVIAVTGFTAFASSSDLAEDLIYEDNNLMTPNDISDIVSTNSVTEYHVGNYNLTTPDQILPQSDAISYGDQQKKNK